jgi:hypothetical protein
MLGCWGNAPARTAFMVVYHDLYSQHPSSPMRHLSVVQMGQRKFRFKFFAPLARMPKMFPIPPPSCTAAPI